MRTGRLILAAIASMLALSACLKQDNEPRGMTDSGYRLTQIDWTDGTMMQLQYDGDNRIQRIDHARFNVVTGAYLALDFYYEYKYDRGRCSQVYYRCLCNEDGRRMDYVYDADGRAITRISRSANGTFAAVTNYRYDGQGRLSEARDSTTDLVTQRLFSYGSGDNLSSLMLYRSRANASTKERYEWRSYDSLHSYIHEIPALPLDDPNLAPLAGYISWTGNNYLVERHYAEVGEDQPMTRYTDQYWGYSYDSIGLPTGQYFSSRSASYRYQKY